MTALTPAPEQVPATVQTGASWRHGYAARGNTDPVYWVWNSMRQRCDNPKEKAYVNYGARGIRVCDRWRDFANFIEDMGPRPLNTTIERIDNNRGYEPGNCMWASWSAQHHNKRISRRNKAGATGVSWDAARNKWKAEIMINRQKKMLGRFITVEEAIAARKSSEPMKETRP